MAWDTARTSDALTLTSSYQDINISSALMTEPLNPRETVHIQVECDFQTTPTDDAVLGIFASSDGGTTYDTEPIAEIVIPKSGSDPGRISISVSGYRQLKYRGKQTGSTDTTNSMKVRTSTDAVAA